MPHYAGLSLYAQQMILDADSGDPWEMPNLYLALDTTEAGADDTGAVEATGVNYERVPVTLAAYAAGARVSDADIFVPSEGTAGAGGWGTIVAFRLMDNASPGAGNIIARGVCTSKLIESGDRYEILAGNLSVSLARTVT